MKKILFLDLLIYLIIHEYIVSDVKLNLTETETKEWNIITKCIN